MPLLKDGQIVDDPWLTVADDEPIPADAPAIISFERWQKERGALADRGAAIGIRLKSDQPPALIEGDLARFGVIALEFPYFKDGRAYSSARLLRERHGYTGEVRAVGHVLRDQYLFMARVGIDAFEVEDDQAVAAWEQAMNEISVFYQPTADGRKTAISLRHQKG